MRQEEKGLVDGVAQPAEEDANLAADGGVIQTADRTKVAQHYRLHPQDVVLVLHNDFTCSSRHIIFDQLYLVIGCTL